MIANDVCKSTGVEYVYRLFIDLFIKECENKTVLVMDYLILYIVNFKAKIKKNDQPFK